jgi:lysophospholipase-2
MEEMLPSQLQVASAAERLRSIPVLLEHCRDDEVITVGNGQHLQGWLQSLGFNVQWREYADGGHWVNEPQGVDDLVGFLRAIMARLPEDGEKE